MHHSQAAAIIKGAKAYKRCSDDLKRQAAQMYADGHPELLASLTDHKHQQTAQKWVQRFGIEADGKKETLTAFFCKGLIIFIVHGYLWQGIRSQGLKLQG